VTIDDALEVIGRDAGTRARLIAALQSFEELDRFSTVRDDITGPVVDALHAGVEIVHKELDNGLVFEFPYRSKIARDFVMSVPERPDHVWEPQTTKLLVQLAHHDVIVGGAYFGDQAIPVAHALADRGTCHAFEPNAQQAAALERNVALNRLTNVRVHAKGLWSEPARLSFVGEDALAGTVASETGIEATTIDLHATSAVGLITLDLEGAELHVLRGAARVLREHAPHVVFEVHRLYVDWSSGLHRTEVAELLTSHGYTLFAIRDFQSNIDLSGRPIELVPIETAFLDGPPHGFNVLAVRDEAVLEPFVITPNVSPKLLRHGDPSLHHPLGGL
jgi:FkbM family methyltransferase